MRIFFAVAVFAMLLSSSCASKPKRTVPDLTLPQIIEVPITQDLSPFVKKAGEQ
jgi:hypothetical protein